jgi:sporulation protein YlmC with PRC-barrel domain
MNPQQAQAPQAAPQNKPAGSGQPSTAEIAQPTPEQQASISNRQRSDLVGKMLFDNAGVEVAKIQDVKTTGDGKIAAAEIDVGGFLGIGSRRIPVPADQLELKGDRVQAKSLSADQIKNLPHETR